MLLVLPLVLVGRCTQSPVRSDADIPYVLVLWEYRGGWCLVHESSMPAATPLLVFPCSDPVIVGGDMLCYVMLCYVMLCYVMLCYVMLCYVMLCYVMLCYVMLLC